MPRVLLIVFMALSSLLATTLHAFNDTKTHRELTQAAIDPVNSNVDRYLITFIGYSSGKQKELEGKDRKGNTRKYKIERWLQEGSTDEDAPLFCRASNHFHNPIHTGDWLQSQMSDSLTIDIACGTSHRYSNVTWATGFRNPQDYIGPRTGQDRNLLGLYDAPQEMGWDNARGYFYDALTSLIPATREEKFVKTFSAMGQVIHLLQDMAVPAHVRNDMDSHLWNNLNMVKWSNAFEKYVVTQSSAINIDPSFYKPLFASPIRHTDFWDKNVYTGDNPTNGTNQGLAEYANANFFSNSTIPKNNPSPEHYFPNPQITNAHYICTDKLPGSTKATKYVSRTACPTDGSPVDHFAAVSLLNRKGTLVASLKNVWLDNNVHDTYAQQILPRAVGYSASLLDYFFRGNIKVTTVNPSDISFRSVKVNVQNTTPGETMVVGEVKLIIRYKALSEWPLGGNKYQLNNPPEDSSPDKYTYKVSISQYVDLTNPQTLTFDFSTDTLPYFFDDMTMQLVFKGKLGNEEGAVAVSQLEPINSVYSDFTVSLPASGVYAKATDSTLGATFNELRVKAHTDIPAGLTGGSFELALDYRKTGGDPFQSLPADTEPVNAAAYLIRIPEKNGTSILQPGTPLELVFDLSSVPLPVTATDVYLNIIYKNSGTSKTMAVGYNDISEPTPVDVFNNADKICINKQWYNAGSPEAIDLVNINVFDPYAHDIANIFTKESSSSNATTASATNFTFQSPALLTGGAFRRLGYVLTDYDFKYSFTEDWIDVSPALDPWDSTGNDWILPGTAVRNQTDSDGVYTYSAMFSMRGKKMWWGASIIFVNTDDEDSECGWNKL